MVLFGKHISETSYNADGVHSTMRYLFFFFFSLTFHSVFCAIFRERALVEDKLLKKFGFHCLSSNPGVGRMKKNEVKRDDDFCAVAECTDIGEIVYASCVKPISYPGCKLVGGDVRKNYPECCPIAVC